MLTKIAPYHLTVRLKCLASHMQVLPQNINGLLEPKHPESLWRPNRPYRLRAGPTPNQLRDDWRRERGVYGLLKLDC